MSSLDSPAESRCCGAALTEVRAGDEVIVRRCRSCGSLWASHRRDGDADRVWGDPSIDAVFESALRSRRASQAEEIAQWFRRPSWRRVLDYGCGQGVFLSELLARGVDAFGCDTDLSAASGVPTERLIALDGPWAVPPGDWDAITMLDVLEHHGDPGGFLSSLATQELVVKVPLSTGPLATAARLLARLGRPALLDSILLVGQVAPHQVLFTRAGLARVMQRAGFVPLARRRLADVGAELPDRMRLSSRMRIGVFRPFVRFIGATVGVVARFWSDTEVSSFVRSG